MSKTETRHRHTVTLSVRDDDRGGPTFTVTADTDPGESRALRATLFGMPSGAAMRLLASRSDTEHVTVTCMADGPYTVPETAQVRHVQTECSARFGWDWDERETVSVWRGERCLPQMLCCEEYPGHHHHVAVHLPSETPGWAYAYDSTIPAVMSREAARALVDADLADVPDLLSGVWRCTKVMSPESPSNRDATPGTVDIWCWGVTGDDREGGKVRFTPGMGWPSGRWVCETGTQQAEVTL